MLKTKKAKNGILVNCAANIPKIKLIAIAGRTKIIFLFGLVND